MSPRIEHADTISRHEERGVGEGPFFLFNLRTRKTTKRSWSTYARALKQCAHFNPHEYVVTTKPGIAWMENHPEWCEEKLKAKLHQHEDGIGINTGGADSCQKAG